MFARMTLYRYQLPNSQLFVSNRQHFKELLPTRSVAFFFANELLPLNADATYPFTQESNFYYLTGIDEPNCIVAIGKEPDREILFIPYLDAHYKQWEGESLDFRKAYEISGIKTLNYKNNFHSLVHKFLGQYDNIYLFFNEHPRNTRYLPTPAHRFYDFLKKHFPAHSVRRAAPLLYQLRMYKSVEEIKQMKRACKITADTFKALLKTIAPKRWEYEVQAEILYHFISKGAAGEAYPSIIAGGKNACVLHYQRNCHLLQDGDLLLMDFGARYGNYCADLSRTVPVNGKFTKKQKQYYEIVLKTYNYAVSLLRPGGKLDVYTQQVRLFMQEELLKIGLLEKKAVENEPYPFAELSRYFMHGVSHMLGLDVHDVAVPEFEFAENMVLTCEPGLYIPEENIGIRLENDIWITADAPVNLLTDAPLLPEEIEDLMAKE